MWAVIFYGGVGGCLPSLFAVAQDLVTGGNLPENLGGWLVGVTIFFALGAALGSASKERLPLKVLAIGLSLPAVVNGALQHSTANQLRLTQPHQNEKGAALLWISPARADGPEGQRQLLVETPSDLKNYKILFYSKGGVNDHVVSGPSSAKEEIAVPSNALNVAVQGSRGWSLPIPLPVGGARIILKIEERSDFSRSFRQLLGASAAPYELEARTQ